MRRKKWRVYQLLVAAGLVKSKSEAVVLARQGKITVNGDEMQSLHYQVHPFKDDIRVNGKKIELKENRQYFILNKPAGIETTKESILRFLKGKVQAQTLNSFSPVGRLDKDTKGLLIITNDGRLGRRILNPKTKRWKKYIVGFEGKLTEEEAEQLRNGITINVEEKPYKTLPAQVTLGKDVHVSIVEGKKRQVRKMLQALGHPVHTLKRVAIAKLLLGDLKEGDVKEYTKEEMYKLLFE